MQFGQAFTVEEFGVRHPDGTVDPAGGFASAALRMLVSRRSEVVHRMVTGHNPVIDDGVLAGGQLRLKTGKPWTVTDRSEWQNVADGGPR